MTIEEKAKAYDEALERARQIKNGEGDWRYSDLIEIGPALTEIFPELRESEDERIRKSLIDNFKHYSCTSDGTPSYEILSWLKKQKEQKPNYCHHEVDETGWTEEYRKAFYDGWNNCNMQHAQHKADQKPVEWSEEDEKILNLTKTQLRILQSHLSHKHSESMSDLEYSSRLLQIETCVSWLDIRLKFLRPCSSWKPSDQDELMKVKYAGTSTKLD